MEVNRFSRDDDGAEQALGESLTFFTRERFKVMAPYWATGLGMVNDLLPMNALLPSWRSLAPFLLNLGPRGRELLTPHVPFSEGESLGLIGIEPALVLTLEPLLALEQG